MSLSVSCSVSMFVSLDHINETNMIFLLSLHSLVVKNIDENMYMSIVIVNIVIVSYLITNRTTNFKFFSIFYLDAIE